MDWKQEEWCLHSRPFPTENAHSAASSPQSSYGIPLVPVTSLGQTGISWYRYHFWHRQDSSRYCCKSRHQLRYTLTPVPSFTQTHKLAPVPLLHRHKCWQQCRVLHKLRYRLAQVTTFTHSHKMAPVQNFTFTEIQFGISVKLYDDSGIGWPQRQILHRLRYKLAQVPTTTHTRKMAPVKSFTFT